MPIDVVDIDHTAIRVSDLADALTFYRDLLGLETRDTERFAAGEVPFVALVAGGRHIHLVPSDEPIDVGGEHLCLLVRSAAVDTRAEIDALIAEIEAAGYTVEDGEPDERYGAYGNDWAIYVRDPDGRRVELKLH
jgi:catechol 2,3-dioxygenase-like lactoylglutathione lyase family enzyme